MTHLAGVPIGTEYPCRVIAEIGNAHNGGYDRCLRLIDGAMEAGADIIKFQTYTAGELVSLRGDGPAPEPWGTQGWTMRALYDKAATPLKWFPRLATYCNDNRIPWFSSVFGDGSLALLEALDCPAYKMASLDYGKRHLLRSLRSTGKPLVASCAAVNAPTTCDVALWCPGGYPQDAVSFTGRFGKYAGFSYHGIDAVVPLLAAAHGANVVECHVQLDDEPSELEASVSLRMRQLGWLTSALAAERVWR
jgi:N-acetylneuraminate synthase